MKRFIIVCLCLFLFSLLMIPAFAGYIPSTVTFVVNDVSLNSAWTGYLVVNDVSYPLHNGSNSVEVDLSSPSVFYFVKDVNNTNPSTVSYNRLSPNLSTDPSNPTVVTFSDTYVLSISGSSGSNPSSYTYYIEFSDFPRTGPLDDLGVSDGVSSFIGWTGSVLSNLVMSPAVIVLVGLSIAMLAFLPWGISKIKSLIKGY